MSIFKENLKKIIQHPLIVEHSPQIVLVTPPPLDERRQFEVDERNNYPHRRSAQNTKDYADTVRQVAEELDLPVVDMWSRFMELAGFEASTWKPGDPLVGSTELPANAKLGELLSDGKWLLLPLSMVDNKPMTAFSKHELVWGVQFKRADVTLPYYAARYLLEYHVFSFSLTGKC